MGTGLQPVSLDDLLANCQLYVPPEKTRWQHRSDWLWGITFAVLAGLLLIHLFELWGPFRNLLYLTLVIFVLGLIGCVGEKFKDASGG